MNYLTWSHLEYSPRAAGRVGGCRRRNQRGWSVVWRVPSGSCGRVSRPSNRVRYRRQRNRGSPNRRCTHRGSCMRNTPRPARCMHCKRAAPYKPRSATILACSWPLPARWTRPAPVRWTPPRWVSLPWGLQWPPGRTGR